MSVVLKEFLWAANGITVETVKVGADLDFGKAAAGLIAEGYVGLGAPVLPPEPVVEPDLLTPLEPAAESAADQETTEPAPAAPAPRKRK